MRICRWYVSWPESAQSTLGILLAHPFSDGHTRTQGRHRMYDDTNGKAIMAEKVEAWIEQLVVQPATWADPHPDPHLARQKKANKHPLPLDVLFIMCQVEACVIGKHLRSGSSQPGHVSHDFGA